MPSHFRFLRIRILSSYLTFTFSSFPRIFTVSSFIIRALRACLHFENIGRKARRDMMMGEESVADYMDSKLQQHSEDLTIVTHFYFLFSTFISHSYIC